MSDYQSSSVSDYVHKIIVTSTKSAKYVNILRHRCKQTSKIHWITSVFKRQMQRVATTWNGKCKALQQHEMANATRCNNMKRQT